MMGLKKVNERIKNSIRQNIEIIEDYFYSTKSEDDNWQGWILSPFDENSYKKHGFVNNALQDDDFVSRQLLSINSFIKDLTSNFTCYYVDESDDTTDQPDADVYDHIYEMTDEFINNMKYSLCREDTGTNFFISLDLNIVYYQIRRLMSLIHIKKEGGDLAKIRDCAEKNNLYLFKDPMSFSPSTKVSDDIKRDIKNRMPNIDDVFEQFFGKEVDEKDSEWEIFALQPFESEVYRNDQKFGEFLHDKDVVREKEKLINAFNRDILLNFTCYNLGRTNKYGRTIYPDDECTYDQIFDLKNEDGFALESSFSGISEGEYGVIIYEINTFYIESFDLTSFLFIRKGNNINVIKDYASKHNLFLHGPY